MQRPTNLRWLRGALFAAAVGGLAFPATIARAQPVVSDADREAARALYKDGFALQQAGKYADALDRFQRAQSVFSAPTNLLHIAECQASLGHLVEAAETYRGLVRLQLPKGSPQSFVAAQQQGAAELQQVEERIPKVRIDVTPANVANLSVTIDDQPMNVALVGVDRPIDPGTHHVVAFAPGYGKQEATITVKEKDPVKPVALALQATGGVVYGPAVGTSPAVVTTGPTGSAQPAGSAQPPPDQPPPYEKKEEWKPVSKPPSASFLAGVRAGADLFAGSLAGGGPNGDVKLSDVAGPGPAFGLEAGVRFARKGYVGLFYEHAFLGAGNLDTSGTNLLPGTTITNSGNAIGATIGFITNPDGFGVLFDGSLAYRWLIFTEQPSGAQSTSYTFGGAELMVGMGLWIKVGSAFRIVPRADVGFGSFSNQSCSGDPAFCPPSLSSTVPNTAGHVFAFLGVGGYFNVDFGKKQAQ